jgi:hypothetical protein
LMDWQACLDRLLIHSENSHVSSFFFEHDPDRCRYRALLRTLPSACSFARSIFQSLSDLLLHWIELDRIDSLNFAWIGRKGVL